MSLRLSLVIDGDASGAKRAAGDTAAALGVVERSARATAAAIETATDANVTSLARLRTEMGRQGGASSGGATFRTLAEGIDRGAGIGGAGGGGRRGEDIDAYGRELDRLRAKFNPLFAAGQQYKATLAEINAAARLGAITEEERGAAIQRTKGAFAQQAISLRAGANEAGHFSSRAMMLQMSLGMTFRQMAAGVPPSQILLSQINQLTRASAGEGGLAGAFKELGQQVRSGAGWLASLVTPTRLAIAGAVGLAAAGALAAHQWGKTQSEVRLALSGIGQASGMAVADVNRVAEAGAATFGLSVREARSFTAALAATGKIGRDNIAPIVAIGRDVAKIYGEDATAAAKRLAAAFADPVKGAEELNQRLGFLDAAMLRQITNLTAQNRVYEAQAVMQRGVEAGLEGMGRQLASSANLWTAVGNSISNVWDAIGRGAARLTGIGFTQGLDEEIAATRARIADLEKLAARRTEAVNRNLGTTAAIERERDALQRLTGEWEKYWRSVEAAQQRRDSFAQSAAVRTALPEIDQLDQINNRYLNLTLTMESVNRTGGAASPVLQSMGVTYEQLAQAIDVARGALAGFKSESDKTIAGLELQIRGVSARSPGQRGQIAFEQALLNRGSTDPAAMREAELSRTLAIRQAEFQIAEAKQAQLLAAGQRVEAAGLELALLGRGGAEQERQRGLLQARQQLEQESLRLYGDREAFDRKHLAALEAQINAEAGIKQALAEQQALRDIAFERAQISRTSGEQQVASRLRGVYGDNYREHETGPLAQGMRTNQQLQQLHGEGLGLVRGINAALREKEDRWKAVGDAAENALMRMNDRLVEMAFNKAWDALFKNLASLFGSGIGFGGGMSAGTIGGTGGGLGGLFDKGGYTGDRDRRAIAGFVHGQEYVFDAETTRRIGVDNLEAIRRGVRGYAGGGFVGAAPPVTARGGNGAGSGGGWRALKVTINHSGAPMEVTGAQANDETGELELETMMRPMIRDELASGRVNGVMKSKYGQRPRTRMLAGGA